jgi:AcrR family transcriptional regulator
MARAARPITERRAATRRRLLDAAIAVVADRGFHAASVDAIAEEAGYSVGAIYSNFGGKDDLFLAVFDEHAAWFESVLDDASAEANAIEAMLDEERQFLVFVSFWSYAVRTPKVRRRLASRMARFREHVARLVERRAEQQGRKLVAPPEQVATLALALFRGIALERLADREAVPDGLLAGALDALTESVTR